MMSISLGGAAVVKNESDIIEAFVRHNLRFLDTLHVVDNFSTDGTFEILTALQMEGLPLEISRDARMDHPQAEIMTSLIKKWGEPCDWVFCLDADEFIDDISKDEFRNKVSALPQDRCVTIQWEFFVPMESNDKSIINPIERITHRRLAPVNPWLAKVVIPGRFLNKRGLRLRPGNHFLEQANGVVLPHRRCPEIKLAHFPIRSHEQLAKKVITGDWAISIRAMRSASEGQHWSGLKRRLLKGELIASTELALLAYNYGASTEDSTLESLENALLEQRPLLSPCSDLQYTTERVSSFMEDALAFADRHFETIRKTALDCGGTRIAKTRFGPMAYPVGDVVIGRSLAEYGEWAGPEIDFLLDLVKVGDIVVDVGANIGTHTIALAKRVGPSGQVIAFEPQRLTLQTLCTNITLNNLDNVKAERVALGAKCGEVSIPVIKQGNLGNIGHQLWGEGELTPLLTLDSYSLPGIDLLKIDVEGMEKTVLEGALKTIKQYQPAIFVENNIAEQSEALISWLFSIGYRCWWFLDPYYNPDNFYGNADNFLEGLVDRPEINMICLPAGTEPPHSLVEILSPNDSWEPAWQAQGLRGFKAAIRWAQDPIGLEAQWK